MIENEEDPHLHVVLFKEGQIRAACSIWSNEPPTALVMNSFGARIPDPDQTANMLNRLAESLNSNRKQ